MESLNLLIIEDESSQLLVYNDAIDLFNSSNNIKIISKVCKNFSEGEQALLSPYFDAAIIDLKLSSTEDLDGIKLVEAAYNKIRVPIFIVSGSISQIDYIPENALLKKRLRTEKMSLILKEIFDIYKTGITSFLKPNGVIDQKLSEIFWSNLSNDLQLWIDHNNKKTLLRYILSHFQEHLEINIDGDFEDYHPSEVYIKPPIKKNIHTGDLIKIENEYFLILTPACDIVIHEYKTREGGFRDPVRKAEKMMLARVKEFNLDVCKNKNGDLDKSKIGEYVNNKQYRYHYLPPFQKNNGFLIDFQDLKSVFCNAVFDRIASISSPFIKDIISRFSSYYSRQGQPTFGQKKIAEDLYKEEIK